MRRLAPLLVVTACSRAPTTMPTPAPMTVTQWTQACRDRVEVARLVLVPVDHAFHDGSYVVETKPWHAGIHFEARTGDGVWIGEVERGHDPCNRDDSPQRGFSDWRDEPSDMEGDVAQVRRYMRIDRDEAHILVSGVPGASAIAFRREMQRALRACLEDGRTVTLSKPPDEACFSDDLPDDF